jgi:heat shock protein HtpX
MEMSLYGPSGSSVSRYAHSVNNVKTAALLGFLGVLFVGVGYTLGGVGGGLLALGVAVVMNFGIYFFSDRIALSSAKAKPVETGELPNVESILSSLAQREQMPMPALYVIDSPQPNAFATGRSPKKAAVAVTTGILEILDYRELEGVLAHELAHVKNRDVLIATVAATIAAALSFLARMAFWSSLGGRRRNGNALMAIVGLIAMVLAPIAAAVIQMAISRNREFEADHDGAEVTGSPLALASALQKISNGAARAPMDVNPALSQLFIADPLKAFGSKGRRGQMGKMFATHPPVEDRVARLEKMAYGLS